MSLIVAVTTPAPVAAAITSNGASPAEPTEANASSVFAHLDRVRIGQMVQVFTDTREFDYTIVSTTQVARTDTSVLAQDSTPAVSLITCTGLWLPTIWDYTERLVVRAELGQQAASASP